MRCGKPHELLASGLHSSKSASNNRADRSLFDFVSAGTLLGPLESFIEHYEAPILAGGDKDACNNEVRWGHAAQASLRKQVEPFFLRRTKDDLKKIEGGGADGDEEGRDGVQSLPTKRVRRHNIAAVWVAFFSRQQRYCGWQDLIVWLPLQPAQVELYQSFLSSPAVKELLNTTRSPLAAISVLKKICDSADYPELRVGECSNGRLGL